MVDRCSHQPGLPIIRPMEEGPKLHAVWLLWLATGGVLVWLAWSHVAWRAQPTHELDILVFDVTVADDGYREHQVIGSVLEHRRIPYDLGADHVGAAPGGSPHGRWPARHPDLIILADGYGVYTDDQGRIDDLGSNLVSAVLTDEQAADLHAWIADGVPAYAEFATIPTPTPRTASELLQTAFGVNATGWLGHAVEDLAELSPRLKSLGPQPWPHEGPGFIFVTTRAGDAEPAPQLVVLSEPELDALYPSFTGRPAGGRGEAAPFAGWFELITPDDDVTVDAWLELPVNPAGKGKLDAAGLPVRWPAVIRGETTMYVVGDLLENTTDLTFKQFTPAAGLTYWLMPQEDSAAFHQILLPALDRTIDLAVARASDGTAQVSR